MSDGIRWQQVVVHADMDAFYASVEQLDDPGLRGKPILVGPNSDRGVVLTASYEARPAGVGSAMAIAMARRRCPDAIIVPPRFERYQQVSRQVMQVFAEFSPVVEPISLDEAFLDMSGAERLLGSPETIGRRLKDAVRDATGGLTVSVGISATKFVAKVASGFRKPDGLTLVPPQTARAWLAPQSVKVLWGAGPKMQARLAALGLRTVGDVAACGAERLEAELGRVGRHFHSLSQAEDPRRVESSRAARSLSSERTLSVDVDARDALASYVHEACDIVARRLRGKCLTARGVRLKLKTHDFRILTRQLRLRAATNATQPINAAAQQLLGDVNDPGPFRLVGIAVYELCDNAPDAQIDFLDAAEDARDDTRLDSVLDALHERFGPGSIRRAAELKDRTVFTEDVNLDYLGRSNESLPDED
jgi:DNA polymerase-4